ncbi:hypothetical protein GOV09_00555 [Candidatus Woesearchaeota archaeon]|nr:hypothetical protein [Candidatus Woesearchaeota archaeon]
MEKITGIVKEARTDSEKDGSNIDLFIEGSVHHEGAIFGKDKMNMEIRMKGPSIQKLREEYGREGLQESMSLFEKHLAYLEGGKIIIKLTD